MPTLAIVGGGPAGLMAAETARAAGVEVDLYEGMGSVGRKFLLAGKGGLNLTHSEPLPAFIARYNERAGEVGRWLADFDPAALRAWARELGVETIIGSSGRVFPADLKAAPLLRGWLRRLRAAGVCLHMHHRCVGLDARGGLRFQTPDGPRELHADAVLLALGGASWPRLGSDGGWREWLAPLGVDIAPLQAANCGFERGWSDHFIARHAGQPVKAVTAAFTEASGNMHRQRGEFVISETGVEGSLIYALCAPLRESIAVRGPVSLELDLAPDRTEAALREALSKPRQGRSRSEWLRRCAGIEGVKGGLLYECLDRATLDDPARLAAGIKALPLRLDRPRPLAEAISTAGGVRLEALDDGLMLRDLPGIFCAGEMLDWEAPTGGYLLTACMASGRLAGGAAADWLRARA